MVFRIFKVFKLLYSYIYRKYDFKFVLGHS